MGRSKVINVSSDEEVKATFQTWMNSGETCPDGTIPIRRTTERDILRSSSIRRFGKKRVINGRRSVRRDSSSSGHEVDIIVLNI